jgi:molybdate transport system substrate-binding protein
MHPMHGYEMAQYFAEAGLDSVSPVEQSLLYTYLRNLEGRRLVRWQEQRVGNRPPRKLYELTPEGREELDAWLRAPVLRIREIRLDFLLKLYFLHQADPEAERLLVTRQIAVCEDYRSRLDDEVSTLSGFPRLVAQSKLSGASITLDWLRAYQWSSATSRREPTVLRRLLPSLALLGLASAFASACGDSTSSPGAAAANPQTITVFAASSLTEAMKESAKPFELQNPGARVEFNFAASSALAIQINEGAPADVFASADAAQMKVVTDKGNAEQPQVFAQNVPVVVAPRDSTAVTSFEDLAKPGLKLVLGAPGVPIGAYSRQILENASAPGAVSPDFSDRVLASLKSNEPNVRSVLTKVQLGEADAGIVYRTDASAAGDAVRVIEIPSRYNVVADTHAAVKSTDSPPRAGVCGVCAVAGWPRRPSEVRVRDAMIMGGARSDRAAVGVVVLLGALLALFFVLPLVGLVDRAIAEESTWDTMTSRTAREALVLSLWTSTLTLIIAVVAGTPRVPARARLPGKTRWTHSSTCRSPTVASRAAHCFGRRASQSR